jgi:hypothetical protein
MIRFSRINSVPSRIMMCLIISATLWWAFSVPSVNIARFDVSPPPQTTTFSATAPAEILTKDHATFGHTNDTLPLFQAFQSPKIGAQSSVSISLIPPLCANVVASLKFDCREPVFMYIATGTGKIRLSVPIDPDTLDRQN